MTNARVASIASASNGQKVGYIDYADSFVEFRVNVPSSGTYTLRTLYGNGWGASSHDISVNGGAPFSQSYANNGIDVWTAATTTVNLHISEIPPETCRLVREAIEAALAKRTEEQRTCPSVTDVDRLRAAFAELEQQGIVALENCGVTLQDGIGQAAMFSLAREERRKIPSGSAR